MADSSFEPVLFDLSDADDYYVLTAALDEFAAQLDATAADEADGDASNPQARTTRILAVRTRRLRNAIEQQLQDNSEARKAVTGI